MSLVLRPACTFCPVRQRLDKALALRVNRLLAWALVISPALQVALRTDFWRGLWLDLGILAAHAGLSLYLFGLPPGTSRWHLALGLADKALSARGSFLLTTWRIALPFLYTPALLFVPWLGVLVGLPALVLWVVLPFNLASHLFDAAHYALRRWRVKTEDARDAAATAIVAAFFWASALNLWR